MSLSSNDSDVWHGQFSRHSNQNTSGVRFTHIGAINTRRCLHAPVSTAARAAPTTNDLCIMYDILELAEPARRRRIELHSCGHGSTSFVRTTDLSTTLNERANNRCLYAAINYLSEQLGRASAFRSAVE